MFLDNAQLSAIHREIHDLMVLRSEQEDLMRRKNEEIHELRGDLESLQRAHTGAKDDMDKVRRDSTNDSVENLLYLRHLKEFFKDARYKNIIL